MATINFFWMSDDQACGIDPTTYHFYQARVENGQVVKRSIEQYIFPESISVEEALEMPVLATYSGPVKSAPFCYDTTGMSTDEWEWQFAMDNA